MPSLKDFLYRFRPAAPPGGGARAGVPRDRVTELTAELQEVFEDLDPTLEEATATVTRGREDAERRRTAGADRAATILNAAREQAEATRARAAAAAVEAAEREREGLLAAASAEAQDVARRALDERGLILEQVVAAVRSTGTSVRATR